MNIPLLELRRAERKCNILAELEEDFRQVIDNLEQKYEAHIHVQVIRSVIGGGAGPRRIILAEVRRSDS